MLSICQDCGEKKKLTFKCRDCGAKFCEECGDEFDSCCVCSEEPPMNIIRIKKLKKRRGENKL